MAMTYLPVHAQMAKLLKKGVVVVHNGGSGYQGAKGIIQSVNLNKGNDNITIKFSEIQHRTGTISYSTKWFLENFYIFVGDIKQMGGFFNGTPYLDKYSDFTLYQGKLMIGKQPTHSMIKKQVDQSNLFEAVNVVDAPSQDLLDIVGEFKLCKVGGELIGNHKTQRCAEIAGAAFVRGYSEKVNIWKLCATIEPVVTVEANINRK